MAQQIEIYQAGIYSLVELAVKFLVNPQDYYYTIKQETLIPK